MVRPIHAKAMPVLLTNNDEWDQWLSAPVEEPAAAAVAAESMRVAMTGEKEDVAA
jgi:putative SOS response-associated peptidase YedK